MIKLVATDEMRERIEDGCCPFCNSDDVLMFSEPMGEQHGECGQCESEWVATYGWDNDDKPDCTQFVSGYMDSRFFHAYGVDGVEILGEAWGQAITDYRDRFHGGNRWDSKTPLQWLLLGDPSLKIGGYYSSGS